VDGIISYGVIAPFCTCVLNFQSRTTRHTTSALIYHYNSCVRRDDPRVILASRNASRMHAPSLRNTICCLPTLCFVDHESQNHTKGGIYYISVTPCLNVGCGNFDKYNSTVYFTINAKKCQRFPH